MILNQVQSLGTVLVVTAGSWGEGRAYYWHLVVETRDAAKYPIRHRTDLQQQRITWSNVSIVPRLRNPALNEHVF